MNRHQRRAEKAKSRKQGSGYLSRMLASTPPAPGLSHIVVQHDDWCGIFQGAGCTCTPDMHRRQHGSEVIEVIEADGSVTRARRS